MIPLTLDLPGRMVLGSLLVVAVGLGPVCCSRAPVSPATQEAALRAVLAEARAHCAALPENASRDLLEACGVLGRVELPELDDAMVSEDDGVPPAGTGSAVPTTPELLDGGVTDAPDGSPGNGVRSVE